MHGVISNSTSVLSRHDIWHIETLEKRGRALGSPMYQLFYEGDNPPAPPKHNGVSTPTSGRSGKEARLMAQFHRLLSRTGEDDRKLLLQMAGKMANPK